MKAGFRNRSHYNLHESLAVKTSSHRLMLLCFICRAGSIFGLIMPSGVNIRSKQTRQRLYLFRPTCSGELFFFSEIRFNKVSNALAHSNRLNR